MTPARPAVRRGARYAAARKSTTRAQDPSLQWQILLLIVAGAFAVHANGLGNGFIYFDDPEGVVDNVSIREFSGTNIGHWFTTPLQFMYTPLVYVSYAIDYLFGHGAIGMYHFTNLILHLANVVLVFLLFRRLTERAFLACFVAVAFAIHPVNADTVAWISARSNLLATLFSLAALLVYLRYSRSQRWQPLAWSVVLFGLAALSKSTAVALPLVLFLVDHLQGRRPSRRLFLEKIPFLVIAAITVLVALNVRQDVVPQHGYTVVDRILLACSALVNHLVQSVYPFHLSLVYEYPHKPFPWYLYLFPLVLAAGAAALWLVRPARRIVVFGLGFFAVTIAPTLAVLLIDGYHANRYAYLPYLGLFLIAGYLTDTALRHRDRRLRVGAIGATAVVLILFATLTIIRNTAWRNTETIMSDAIAKEPGVALTYNSRGIARFRDGNYTDATSDFERTVELDPDFVLAHHYLGLIKYHDRDYTGALRELDYEVSRLPTFAAAYSERGKVKIALRDYSGAYADLSTAIAYDPQLAEAYYSRGAAGIGLGNPRGAISDLNAAIGLIPQYADAYYQRGVAESRLGDTGAACADWNAAVSLGNPDANKSLADNHCAG
ncbi:glycosyltransferase family 39 protein [Microbispora catharanthi]|uniref:Tetratricopeptide repeat protein n=1 Tax=Microbispora catharanthi TaxID=1712871 RepID=A0A5N6B241_9ACTN|nr:tetratricopeptide repeat protein [Microbispora catharanthi]KAB8174496.1 tetratricopeptide repeat protein [Microbispora catharanthi]